MSLKLVTILVMAGLMAQSSLVLSALRGDSWYPIPGFTYTSEPNINHGKLSMRSDKGELAYLRIFQNTSAWSFLPGNGSATIYQETSFPILQIHYRVHAKVGDIFNDYGHVIAKLKETTFNFSLTANEKDNKCDLDVKLEKIKEGMKLRIYHVDDVFDYVVRKDVMAAIWSSLTDVIPTTFKTVVEDSLPSKIDEAELCEQILAATSDDFPEPDL